MSNDKKEITKAINQIIDNKDQIQELTKPPEPDEINQWAKPPKPSPAPEDIAPLPPEQEGDGESNPQQEGDGNSPPKQSEDSNTDSKEK